MQAATVSPEHVKYAIKGAILKGYNPEKIIQKQGLPVQILTNPRLRISTLAFAELSRALTELLRDESVGLLAKYTPIGSLNLMAKACLSSTTIGDSLNTWRDCLNLINMRSKEDLQELLTRPLAHIMRQPRQSNSSSLKVRHWMEQLFRDGEGYPRMSEACAYLGLTEPTLRRRLSAEGCSFKQLKEDTRRDMAIFYIKQSDLSIEEIGFKLGFSEASTFIRSFKKWTGVTPLVYRKM